MDRPSPSIAFHRRPSPSIAFHQVVDGCGPSLTSLSLRACSLLGPDAVASAARRCAALRDLDLEGVELMTDAAALEV